MASPTGDNSLLQPPSSHVMSTVQDMTTPFVTAGAGSPAARSPTGSTRGRVSPTEVQEPLWPALTLPGDTPTGFPSGVTPPARSRKDASISHLGVAQQTGTRNVLSSSSSARRWSGRPGHGTDRRGGNRHEEPPEDGEEPADAAHRAGPPGTGQAPACRWAHGWTRQRPPGDGPAVRPVRDPVPGRQPAGTRRKSAGARRKSAGARRPGSATGSGAPDASGSTEQPRRAGPAVDQLPDQEAQAPHLTRGRTWSGATGAGHGGRRLRTTQRDTTRDTAGRALGGPPRGRACGTPAAASGSGPGRTGTDPGGTRPETGGGRSQSPYW